MSRYDDAVDQVLGGTPEPAQDLPHAARVGVGLSIKTDPVYEAGLRDIAKRTGIALDAARQHPEEVKQQAALNAIDFAKLANQTPKTAAFLSNPDNAAVAHDDIDALGNLEQGLRALPSPTANLGNIIGGLASNLSFTPLHKALKLALHDAFGDTGSIEGQVRQQNLLRQSLQATDRRDALQPAFESATAQGIYSGGASLMQMLPAMGLSVATGSPAPLLISAGASQGVPSYAKYLDRGASTQDAALGAIGEGAAEVGFEMLPMGFLVKNFGKAGAGKFLTGLLAREIPTEQATTVVQDAIDTAIANPDKTWAQYAQERPDAAYQTLLATITQAGITSALSTATNKLSGSLGAAQSAQQAADRLDAATKLAAASKVGQRSPDVMHQFIEESMADSQAKSLFIDAKSFAQSGVADQVLKLLPDLAEQYQQAALTGGEIEIKVADYLATIAHTDLANALTDIVRLDGEDFTRAEANSYLQSHADEFQQEVDNALADHQGQSQQADFTRSLQDALKKKIGNVSKFSDKANAAYATLLSQYYNTTANKLGMTAQDLFDQHPINMAAESVGGDVVFGQPKNNQPLAGDLKQRQFDIINAANPMLDNYHTGIRSVADIKTLEETVNDEEWAGYDNYMPDYTAAMAQKAIESGKITVYSSYPIAQGVFVTPSKMEAKAYSGDGKVYSKEVSTAAVAWIDPTQGQYAEVADNVGSDLVFGQPLTAQTPLPEGQDTIMVDGVKRSTINSNGQAIHSTVEGVEDFWRWFGDSDNTDDDGSPIFYYHNSYSKEITHIQESGTRFDGLFAVSEGKSTHYGKYEYVFAAKNHLSHREFSEKLFDIDNWDDVANVITDNLYDFDIEPISNEDYDILLDLIAERKDLYDAIVEDEDYEGGKLKLPDWIVDIFGTDDTGEVSWDLQKTRGKLAKLFGADVVDMKDEQGMSALLLPGDGVRQISNSAGEFKPSNPNILNQTQRDTKLYQQEINFYSDLQRGIESAPDKVFNNAKQIKPWLTSNAAKLGIKKDELYWSGIEEWLDIQTGKVTKADVLAFLQGNGVQVEDVLLNDGSGFNATVERDRLYEEELAAARKYDYADGEYYRELIIDKQAEIVSDIKDTEEEVEDEEGDVIGYRYTYNGETKEFEDSQDDEELIDEFGLDYETVFDLFPADEIERYAVEAVNDNSDKIDEQLRRIQEDYELGNYENQAAQTKHGGGKLVIPGGTDYAELVLTVPSVQKFNANDTTHFGDTGGGKQIAWIRYDSRTDMAGKPTLFLEEIQSQRGAQGRTKGFKTKQNETGLVPPAPFITDSKNKATNAYISLLLKKAIGAAISGGKDSVSWTTAEQQTKRYNLHDVAKQITATRNDDNSYDFEIIDWSDEKKSFTNIKESAVTELVGAELGSKIIAQDQPTAVYEGDMLMTPAAWTYAMYGDSTGSNSMGQPSLIAQAAGELARKYGGKVGSIQLDVGQQPALIITPEMRQKILDEGFALFQKSRKPVNRGSFSPDTNTITLLKNADLSTFLHESGHFFLEMQMRLAASLQQSENLTPEQQKMLADTQTILDWFGVESVDHWFSLSFEESRSHHEQFARGFEAYLFEGKAPSLALQDIFRSFRQWLIKIYRQLRALNVELTPEVRSVMDRMLASEEEITLAEQARSLAPLFENADQAGWTAEEFANYQNLGKNATQEGIDQLQTRSIRDMQWLQNARNKKLKELQAVHDDLRQEVRLAARAEVMARPVYQAWAFFTAQLPTDDTPPVMGDDSQDRFGGLSAGRLNVAAINTMGLPEAQVKRLVKLGMTAENEIHPDFYATMFGFSSGHEMVQALATAKKPESAVEQLTNQKMHQDHAELSSSEAIARAVDLALSNEARAKMIATEEAALAKATGSVRLLDTAAKDYAKAILGRTLVKDISPIRFSRAETKAAQAAQKALRSGNLALAAAEKRNQLVNMHLKKSSHAALEDVEKMRRYFRRFGGRSNTLDVGYLAQINGLLAKFDLRTQSNTEIKEAVRLRDWVQKRLTDGELPVIAETLLNPQDRAAYIARIESRDAQGNLVYIDDEERLRILAEAIDASDRRSYKLASYEELQGLYDTIQNLEHLARLKSKLLTTEDLRTFAGIRDEIAETIINNGGEGDKNVRTPNDVLGKLLVGVKDFGAAHIKVATWARILDGGKDNGPVWRYLVKPANERATMETSMRAEATKALDEILAPVLAGRTMWEKSGSGIYFDSIGTSLNWQERFTILLNMGNESNLQRLLGGGISGKTPKLTMPQVLEVVKTLRFDEIYAAQRVWDLFETYRPLIAEKEKRVTGVEPNWIPIRAITLTAEDGREITLRGGYYPVRFDPRVNIDAQGHANAQDAKDLMKASYSAATTRRNFVKERVPEVHGRPLLLGMTGLYAGLNDVIHDLAWHEWVIDANRLLKARKIDEAIRNHWGAGVKKEFDTWRNDIIVGQRVLDHGIEKAAGIARQYVSASGLGFNLVSAAMQPLGISNSIARLGAHWVGLGVSRYVANPKEATREAKAKSTWMENRTRTQFRELNELRNRVQGQTAAKELMGRYTYFLMMKAQLTVDVPTWWAGYEKAMAQGFDEQTAIALADQGVKDSQGGGEEVDQSGIERGHALVKLFTAFYGFMGTTLNVAYGSTMTESNKGKLAANLLLTLTVPAVLGYLFKMAIIPSGDDEPEEPLAKRLAQEQLSFLMGMVAFGREFSGMVHTTNMGYSGPTGLRVIPDIYKLGVQVGQGDFDDAFRKQFINVLGDLSGIPAVQINRTITGANALIDNKTDNPLALGFGYRDK